MFKCSPAKNRNDPGKGTIVVGMVRFRRSTFSFFLTSIRRSSFRFSSSSSLSPLHPRPLSRTDNDVHYFLLLQCAQGNGRSRVGCRGCSLAPRKIIRCRYAITTFASAKWKRFRFFAPASDGRWLRFSEPTIVFGFAGRRREKERDRNRLIGDKLYTLESHHNSRTFLLTCDRNATGR